MKHLSKDRLLSLWAVVYLLLIATLSAISVKFSLVWFIILLLLALPFIYRIESYVSITLLLSTIWYYFTGASESFFSIYTILIILIVLRALFVHSISVKINILFLYFLMLLWITLSYIKSSFNNYAGWVSLIYIIVVSMVLCCCIDFSLDLMIKELVVLTCILVIAFAVIIIAGFGAMNYQNRLSISDTVNANTFGKSCAQLMSILFIWFYLSKQTKFFILGLTITVLAFLSGSRGALLAGIVAILIVIIINERRAKHLTNNLFVFSVLGVIVLIFFILIIPSAEIDFSRYSLKEIIETGGSSRLSIYQTVLGYCFRNDFWLFGYGPGHLCSSKVIYAEMGLEVTNAHNTFIESFGELGLIGLILTALFYFISFRNIIKLSVFDSSIYIVLGMLICLLINGMVESFFVNYFMWALIAVSMNVSKDKRKIIE